jgi:hypothetical protein
LSPSFIIEKVVESARRKAFTYNLGQPPPTAEALQLPLPLEDGGLDVLPEYKPSYQPESFVYICNDPNNCNRGFLFSLYLWVLHFNADLIMTMWTSFDTLLTSP